MLSRLLFVTVACSSLALAADPNLTCPSGKVHPGDKITVKGLGVDHAGWVLSIQGADLDYLISFDSRIKSSYHAPISPEKLANLTEITIDTASAVGIPFSQKTGTVLGPPRPIFTKTYPYTVVLASGLGEGATFSSCAINFVVSAKDDRSLTCPKQVSAGDKLIVKDLPPNHEGWVFGVHPRDTTTEYLISFDSRTKSQIPPPIPPHEFSRLTEITLDPQTAQGVPLDLSTQQIQGPAQQIFSKSAVYTVIVAPPRSAPGLGLSKSCSVEFKAQP